MALFAILPNEIESSADAKSCFDAVFDHMRGLEEQIETLTDEKAELEKKIHDLEQEVKELESEIEDLERSDEE